ncbi:hypothetical protein [Amycolatopsis sp. WAC 01416]|uniref:hypothetical protein n=1 Tax=Amycolatopsis sp. WAC 01416 TaxID=2203196 RepID=UPI000F77C785|nr:hypothetical protein [Amycolatopsis sp. WAC 01416]
MLNSQHVNFLDGIEEELSSPKFGGSSGRSLREASRLGVVATTLLAGASLLAMLPGTASAESREAISPVTVMACSTPDPIPQFQSKWCNFMNYVFNYLYNYSPNGIVRCYVFDVTIYHIPCGGTARPGNTEACA